MQKNPYTLVFGKEPVQIISRLSQTAQIMDAFSGENPTQQVFMITGVRGSGKTVFLTELSKRIGEAPEWIVAELNPERDMLESMAAKLSSDNRLARIFRTAKINLSFFGFGVEIGGTAPITDIETALAKMLQALKKQGKKVLLTIDEVSNTKEMRVFTSAFQILIRQDLPVYLLMTGLYENISALQDEKNLTFLYRAPKLELQPLNIGAMAANYRENLNLEEESALHLAKLTRGYSFAFQVLGYSVWEHKKADAAAIRDYKQYLEEYSYEKIWSGLSRTDRKIIYGIAKSEDGRISKVREILGFSTNQFNPYRKRLIRKGIINGDTYGYVKFSLPMFEEFVLENYGD